MDDFIKKIFIYEAKIIKYFPKFIQPDKLYHFIICFTLSFLFGTHGVAASFSASITKEFSDSLNPNIHWSWGDIIADFLGIVIGYPLGLIIFKGDFMLNLLYNLIY